MKNTLTIGTLLHGCCLAAAAQTGSSPNQTPPISSTPSTFPQDQTTQSPSNPASPSSPSAIPPDTSATGSASGSTATGSTASSAQPTTTVQGCLSQAADGDFILADSSGNSYQLRGDNAQLNRFVGKVIRAEGTASPSSAAAMASSTSGSSAGTTQFAVSAVRKVGDSCPTK